MYRIVVDESVKLFIEENKISASRYFKSMFEVLKTFPRSGMPYEGSPAYRTYELVKCKLSVLYKVDEIDSTIYIIDMRSTASSIDFKMNK